MIQSEKDFCFCTLALGSKYRNFTKQLAKDLEKYSPGTLLIVGTDETKDFATCTNVIPFKHRQQGILHCYYDRRFIIARALSQFRAAIVIDADTKIVVDVPDIKWPPGMTAGHQENLIEHNEKYNPERLRLLENVASKLDLSLADSLYIGESLYIIARDEGREREYLKIWGMIGNYLELKGIHSGEGNAMGLAAAKVGWTVKTEGWEKLKRATEHLDASLEKNQRTSWENFKHKLGYHYRLNRARLAALKDFNFYYY